MNEEKNAIVNAATHINVGKNSTAVINATAANTMIVGNQDSQTITTTNLTATDIRVGTINNYNVLDNESSKNLREILLELQKITSTQKSESKTHQISENTIEKKSNFNYLKSFSIDSKELVFIKKIGAGGFSNIYLGEWYGQRVAIKKLRKAGNFNDELIQELLKEAKIMEKLKNPVIVTFYGICLEKRCIVMEHIPMGSLYNFLRKKSVEELSWCTRYIIAKDIIEGLSYIHSKNILHRDIKSLNVLLTHDYKAKLIDFGLSYQKITTEAPNQTLELKEEEGRGVGTLAWMAPELFSLNPTYSTASDIYGYGIILCEMASHKLPYARVSDQVLRRLIVSVN